MMPFAHSLRTYGLLCMVVLMGLAAPVSANPANSAAESTPELARAKMIEQARTRAHIRKQEALKLAKKKGWAVRGKTRDGSVFELVGVDKGEPQYRITQNKEAAISTAADLVRETLPYDTDGSGVIVGVWDGGIIRDTHQEFGVRVDVIDTTASQSNHATHVAGTLGASGVDNNAKGMAPATLLLSYDWDNDAAEMMSETATAAGQHATKIYLSNHSYGQIAGWDYGDFNDNGSDNWYFFGRAGDSEDDDFGQYDSDSASWDTGLAMFPYLLPFTAAGNDRTDNPLTHSSRPLNDGDTYYRYNGSWNWEAVVYNTGDPIPTGDGETDGGYDTVSDMSTTKNFMVVGAVGEAATNGLRDLSNSNMASFSAWGPTDDGRIKPDIVANGVNVYSTGAGSDTDYLAGWNGTSMATPNACGSAALLVDLYRDRTAGGAMRAAMLKGLIIHTADDMGNAGPDYQFGWGMMNTKAAADLILDHVNVPTASVLTEAELASGALQYETTVTWDGESELRATLSWTDPGGPVHSGIDDATPVLINDLDLRIIAPDGATTYQPFILDRANPSALATTGDNYLDNVEQVRLASPTQEGLYTVLISIAQAPQDGTQSFSLIVSGQALSTFAVEPEADANATGGTGGPFTPASQDYTLRNHGNTPLDWTALTTATWLTLSSESGTLAAGGNQIVSADINAAAEAFSMGSYAATITFANTSGIEVFERTFNLTISNGEATVSPLSWDASDYEIDLKPSIKQTIAIQNTGDALLSFTGDGIVLAGPDADQFRFEATPSTSEILPGFTNGVKLLFEPDSVGEKRAELVITTDDPSCPTITVPLSGMGVDNMAGFSADILTFTEGDGTVAVPITLTPALTEAEFGGVLDYAVTGGSAEGEGVDYWLVGNGVAGFSWGDTVHELEFVVVDDDIDEPAETVIIELYDRVDNHMTLGSPALVTVRILDNDGVPNAATHWMLIE